jgi:hypothetical protein
MQEICLFPIEKDRIAFSSMAQQNQEGHSHRILFDVPGVNGVSIIFFSNKKKQKRQPITVRKRKRLPFQC